MQDTPLCGRHRNGSRELADSWSYLANSAQRADRDPNPTLRTDRLAEVQSVPAVAAFVEVSTRPC